ncbi:phospholipid scramblase 1-like isoform X2 [Lineus longissimus]
MPMQVSTNQSQVPGAVSARGQVTWMPRPGGNCSIPGLEYLQQVDQILIMQSFELLEIFTNWECKNKYRITNSMGQQVYFAQEESEVMQRQCCGPARGFTMHITDNMGQEVIRMVRPFKCCAGWQCCACCDGCSMDIAIEAPPGQIVGYVAQECTCCDRRWSVMDAGKNKIFEIRGDCCVCQWICCPKDIPFDILTNDGSGKVGSLAKQWGGMAREMFTNADNYCLSFPIDLDVKLKATLLGGAFLVDFMLFEGQNRQGYGGYGAYH